MLKGIPDVISPELLKVLAEMGHGDCPVIGDANYPAASNAKDGVGATTMLDAILTLFPLDEVEHPVLIMNKQPQHQDLECPVWDEFKEIVAKHDPRGADAVGFIERFDFYEKAFYSCLILQKGCL